MAIITKVLRGGVVLVGAYFMLRGFVASLTNGAAPAAPPRAAAAPAPAAPAPPSYAVSVASFVANELDECIDWELLPKPGLEAKALEQRQKLIGAAKPTQGKEQTTFVLGGTCAAQVSGRTELARCDVDRDAEFGRLRVKASYFRHATVGSEDGYLQDCLTMKGQWHANANALERARLQGHIRQLEKLAETGN